MARKKKRHSRCKFCKEDGVKFVKSHIIPRSFFKQLKGSDPYSVVASAEEGKVEKKQAGIWDAGMLCDSCERKFGDLDSYGWKILGSLKSTHKPLLHNLQLYGYAADCDVDKLHRFVLSVFWRACASDIDAFKSFRLFKYETGLLQDVCAKEPLDANFYQSIVFRLHKDFLGEFSNVMFEPLAHPQKDGSYMCQMNLPGFKIVTFISSPEKIPEWMKLSTPRKLVTPFLSASMNQQEVRFLVEWRKKFFSRGESL